MNTTTKQDVTATFPAATRPMEAAKPPRILSGLLALEDFEEAARRYLPRPALGLVSGGGESNVSRTNNRTVFDELALVPRMLVDTSTRSTKTTLFGRTYDAPFGIAPMGATALAAYRGDVVLARAAAE